jgi:hypothetical protein
VQHAVIAERMNRKAHKIATLRDLNQFGADLFRKRSVVDSGLDLAPPNADIACPAPMSDRECVAA